MAEVQKTIDLSGTFVDHQSRRNAEALTADGALRGVLTAAESLDFGSIGAGLQATLPIDVPGARSGDPAIVAVAGGLVAGITMWANVPAAGEVVTVYAVNNTAGAIDPAARVHRVMVFNFSE